ncbi:hypothetical protein [Vibrio fortis]|uniref:hypothetical protein n=1 Tax=Vibrio fortis TaxID=212667 RepID=UPI0038CD8D82
MNTLACLKTRDGSPKRWCARAVVMSTAATSLLSASALANDNQLSLAWDWQVSAETVQSRETPWLSEPEYHRQSVNALLDLEVNYAQWLGLFSIKGDDLYHEQSRHELPDSHSDTQLIVRELFWQHSVSLSNALLGEQYIDVTLGKMRLDWGVGYGYRPLDVIKPYRQNPVGILAEEGAGVASLSMFDDSGEWTLLYSDSSWGSQEVNQLERASEQQGVGFKRYNLIGDHEYQWLAYYDDVRHGLLGASLVSVLNLAWEFHGSMVYQRHSLGYSLPDDQYQPVQLEEQGDAFQALVGLTWANDTGHNIVLEYWYDSRAWSHSEWQTAIDRAQDLSLMPATQPLVSAYTQGYQHANIVEHNLMAHWSLDSSGWRHWFADGASTWAWLDDVTPTLDLMIAPQDGGIIATQWINYQAIDNGSASVELELAARFLGGNKDSAYANLPDSHMILLNIKGRF